MIANMHTDTEMMRDGTRRWLWQVRADDRLFAAGVCQTLICAESEAQRAMVDLRSRMVPKDQEQPTQPTAGASSSGDQPQQPQE